MIKTLKSNNLLNNIFLMSAMTILAQSINVISQPVLTRLVPAETLGIFTFLISLANIAIPITSLKLDMLIVSEPDNDKAQYITDSCIFLTFIVSTAYLILIGIAYLFGGNIFCKYGAIVFVVPFMVFTNGIRFLFISYNNRYRQYKKIGIVGVVREFSRAVIQIVSGIFAFGIIGQSLGYLLAPLFGLRFQCKEYICSFQKRSKITLNNFKNVLVDGKEQILYLVPAQFVGSFSSSLIVIFITSLYTSKELGYYSASVRLLEIPLIFIAANVSKVCYKQISECVTRKEKVSQIFIKISLILFAISVLGFCTLYVLAPSLSNFIFGNGYRVAGMYIRCLCLMYGVRLVSTSFVGIYTIFGKQRIELYMTVLIVLCSFCIYYFCKINNCHIQFFLWLISFAYSLLYGSIWLGYFLLCRRYDSHLME